MKKTIYLLFALVFVYGSFISCSGMDSPTLPQDPGTLTESQAAQDNGNRLVFGFWEIMVDEGGVVATVITERSIDAHLNVKQWLKPPYCSDCISFSNVSNDTTNQILSADVTLRNPYQVSGADVRGIVMSNNPGIYLTNPDDYTTFYDIDDPPDKNPFRLFGKELTDGIVGPQVEITEHFDIHYTQIPFAFSTAVDAIAPTDSFREPYSIMNQTIDGALDINGMVARQINLDVYDRHDDTGNISVTAPDLGLHITLSPDPAEDNHYIGWVTNNNAAAPGDYEALISANDSVEPWILYDYLTITVTESLGSWEPNLYSFTDEGCSRDFGTGFDMFTGNPSYYHCGGSSCDEILQVNAIFEDAVTIFNLVDIDPLLSGFSPYPITRIDSSYAGGFAFFADSEEIYSDGFYEGPVSSLLVTLFPGMTGELEYINPGDGDSGRMYPTETTLKGVDTTDDTSGNVYGFWADPAGVHPPEIYGLLPDYTRHDVFMGDALPPEMVGTGFGKVSPNFADLKAMDIAVFGFDSGILLILESYGGNCELEVIEFLIDSIQYTTTFNSVTTIDLGPVEGVDMDVIMFNPMFSPNPEYDTAIVMVQGSTGGYFRLFSIYEYLEIEGIGSESEPIIPGTAAFVDADNASWTIVATNQDDSGVVISWEL